MKLIYILPLLTSYAYFLGRTNTSRLCVYWNYSSNSRILMLCLVIKIKSLDELRLFHSFQSGAPLYLYVKRAYISNRVIIDMLVCCSSPNFNQTRWYRSGWEFKYCYSPVNLFARLSDTAYSTYYVNHWMRSYARLIVEHQQQTLLTKRFQFPPHLSLSDWFIRNVNRAELSI
jgi:hypothetical protein